MRLHGLQAIECTLGFTEPKELAVKAKGTVASDSASADLDVLAHALETAAAYEEESARVHGLDGLHLQHLLSLKAG